MTVSEEPTWWEAYQSFQRFVRRSPHGDAEELLTDDALQLLAEVEEAFEHRGGTEGLWADAHLQPDGTTRDSVDEEYSRIPDAGRYEILWTRTVAWIEVLTSRGLVAERIEIDGPDEAGWFNPPWRTPARTTLLRPRRADAQSMRLARSRSDDGVPTVEIGMGDPAVLLEDFPDCACDACDSGSRDLLEVLDHLVLSIVDGSLLYTRTEKGEWLQTSFTSGYHWTADDDRPSVRISAGPWARGWIPREVQPPQVAGPVDS